MIGEKCDICKTNDWEKVKSGYFVCNDCDVPFVGVPSFHVSVSLMGNQFRKREIDEVKRGRILPYKAPDNDYYRGRMGDNGKIQEVPLKEY